MHMVYALLVGIDEYASDKVRKLHGCQRDVSKMDQYLRNRFSEDMLVSKTLLGQKATKDAVIYELGTGLFLAEGSLKLPGEEDIVLFYFSGHGSQEPAPPEFLGMKLETFLCYDSRTAGVHDLADKEIAALLEKISVHDPHVVLIFDSCHSGSITRNPSQKPEGISRHSPASDTARSLADFLPGFYPAADGREAEGYYERQLRLIQETSSHTHGERTRSFPTLDVPKSRHILLAACDRNEEAIEYRTGGAFTAALIEALEEDDSLSYARLFTNIRARIRYHEPDQHPQCETYLGFNAYFSFLQNMISDSLPLASVQMSQGGNDSFFGTFRRTYWIFDQGAIHGIPSDVASEVLVDILLEEKKVARGKIVQVYNKTSKLIIIDGKLDEQINSYDGRIISLPTEPLFLELHPDSRNPHLISTYAQIKKGLKGQFPILFDAPHSEFALQIDKRLASDEFFRFRLIHSDQSLQVGAAIGPVNLVASYLYDQVLLPIHRWKLFNQLQNSNPQLDPDAVRLEMISYEEEGQETVYQDHCQLRCRKQVEDGEIYWDSAPFEIHVKNETTQPLFTILFELDPDFGCEPVSDQVELFPGTKTILPFLDKDDNGTIIGESKQMSQYIDSQHQGPTSFSIYKVILSTERMDEFIWQQKSLDLGFEKDLTEVLRSREDNRGDESPQSKLVFNDWFTKRLDMTLIKEEMP